MINQEKIRLMAQAEWRRTREKRGALRINRYGKGAYVSLQIVRALIFCTLGSLIAVMMWCVFRAEELLSIYEIEEYVRLARQILAWYGAAMLMSAVWAGVSSSRRYVRARGRVKKYYLLLRRINQINEEVRRRQTGFVPPVKKEVGRR